MAFEEIDPWCQNLWCQGSISPKAMTISQILEGICAKNLEGNNIICVDLAKAFDSLHRGKMEQILLAYSLPEETIAAITMLYRKMTVKVHSSDGDTDYFDIVAGVLQGDTLAPCLFIICLDYVLRMSIDKMKDNGFELTRERSRRYHTKTISDVELHQWHSTSGKYPHLSWNPGYNSLEQAAADIGLHVNAHKTEYMCFNQTGNISMLNGSSLKLVNKFTYLGSSISSTKTDIN